MLLGVGNAAVEVVPIDQVKNLLEHIPLLLLQLTGIFTATQNKHQVVPFPQHRRITEGLQRAGMFLRRTALEIARNGGLLGSLRKV